MSKRNGRLIINSGQPENYHHWQKYNLTAFDATSLALEVLKKPITNTAMLEALIAVSGIISLESAIKGLQFSMGKSVLG